MLKSENFRHDAKNKSTISQVRLEKGM